MHILIVRNNSNSHAVDASLLLAAFFASQGVRCTMVDATDLGFGGAGVSVVRDALEAHVDMAVVLGGDGTLLRTARCIGTSGVPLLGLNYGRLGFLANASDAIPVAAVAAALAGDVAVEHRANLRIDVVCEGETDPWGENTSDGLTPFECKLPEQGSGLRSDADARAQRTFFALNEVAVTRGSLGRIVDFSLDVSGSRIAAMRGDGLVVATATGSTGYALSIGGPLIAPSFEGLVVVPIAPHTLHSRAIVTGESDVVEMDLSHNAADRAVTLFVDGDMVEFDAPIRHVYVRRGEAPTVLYRTGSEGFYDRISKVFF